MKRECLGILLIALAPVVTNAQERWTCGYQPAHEPAITCVREAVETVRAEAAAVPAWAPATGSASFARWEKVMIPLHVAPRDRSRLPVLARDVMCGRRASCVVDFVETTMMQAKLGSP